MRPFVLLSVGPLSSRINSPAEATLFLVELKHCFRRGEAVGEHYRRLQDYLTSGKLKLIFHK